MLRIYLTGDVTLETGSTRFSDWRAVGRQGRLAFAMLAAEHGRSVSRDELVDEIWPDNAPPSRDRALTAIISKLRTFLLAMDCGPMEIASAFGCYHLRLPKQAWIDIQVAADAIDRAEGAVRNGEVRAAWPLAQIACHITRRPFLPGDEGPWCQRTRRELHRTLHRAHECLACIYIQTSEYATAVIHASQAVEHEPFRETSHLLLMRAYAAAGNRAEALRAYDRCRVLLAEELGVSPSTALETAYLAILQGHLPG